MMSLFSRHVLQEWALAFALTISVIIGILVLQNMMDKLPDLLDANASFRQICLFFALTLPTYIRRSCLSHFWFHCCSL